MGTDMVGKGDRTDPILAERQAASGVELKNPGDKTNAWRDVIMSADSFVRREFPDCQRIPARLSQLVPDTAYLYTKRIGNKLNVVVICRAKLLRTDHHLQDVLSAKLFQDVFSHRETGRTARR